MEKWTYKIIKKVFLRFKMINFHIQNSVDAKDMNKERNFVLQ